MNHFVYELYQVVKQYGGREICAIESLNIQKGEILGLIGPSGAGKSTLLRLLNFLEAVDAGFIRFNGWKSNGQALPSLEMRRQATMVFQEPLLLNTSVASNVAYGLRLRQGKEVAQKVQRALEQVGLAHLAKAPALSLSGGEKQRVSLARALVVEPEVLLLDEPTANLDPYNVALIEGLATAVNQEQGITIVWVTHNIFQARRLCHRVGLLLDGRLVELANTEDFFTHPQDPRTAAFIRGEMIY